jgi:hypothetical protein
MQIFQSVVTHPQWCAVAPEPGCGFQGVVTTVDAGTGRRVRTKINLPGCTKPLRERFFPDYQPVYVSKQPRGGGAGDDSRTTHRKRRRQRSFRQRVRQGLATGTLVHQEMHQYIKAVDFVSLVDWAEVQNGRARAALSADKAAVGAQRNETFLNIVREKQKTSVHECTHAIIKAILTKWKWFPVAAEWCVGDVRGGLAGRARFATQIDLVAVHQSAATSDKLILCEVKTGYNHGVFELCNAPMQNFPTGTPTVANSPLNQAKMQLVFGALLLQSLCGVSLDQMELYVIYCPTAPPAAGTAIAPTLYTVSSGERAIFARALHAQRFV